MTSYIGLPFSWLPRAKYGAIVADPPWSTITYDKRSVVPQRASAQHYETMSLDDLKALPVANVAKQDCILHMWVISSHVDQAISLGEAWGFTYKSLGLIWLKLTGQGNLKMGMGHWFRQEAEISLLFTRGHPSRSEAGVRHVIMSPVREHSQKPEEGFGRIERLTKGPYLELFGRTPRPNWDVWGNQELKERFK